MDKSLILEYECSLKLENVKCVPPCYLKGKEEAGTLILVRYAIERILHYTPYEAERILTYKMLENLKLMDYIDSYVTFLAGLNVYTEEKRKNGKKYKNRDLSKEAITIKYLLNKCYPQQIKFNKVDYIKKIYERVLDKEITYPKGFFQEKNDGQICACVCLTYFVSRFLVGSKAKNVYELYEIFSNKAQATKLLKKYSLYKPLKDLYGGDTLAFLHYSLPDKQRSDFLFRYYKFYASFDKLGGSTVFSSHLVDNNTKPLPPKNDQFAIKYKAFMKKYNRLYAKEYPNDKVG